MPEHTDLVPRLADSTAGASFWDDKYNFWSGTIGGLFLMLSYFGCDQSQVQRLLAGKVGHAQAATDIQPAQRAGQVTGQARSEGECFALGLDNGIGSQVLGAGKNMKACKVDSHTA